MAGSSHPAEKLTVPFLEHVEHVETLEARIGQLAESLNAKCRENMILRTQLSDAREALKRVQKALEVLDANVPACSVPLPSSPAPSEGASAPSLPG